MITKKLLTTFAFAFVLLFSGCAEDDFVEIDGVCPLVISTIPENLETEVPIDQVISATFNEKMDPSTMAASFNVADNGTLIDGTVTYTDSTATFTPSSLLDYDTEYTGTIKTTAKDLRGNALQEDYVWTFTTGIPTQFTVLVSSNPVDGGLTTVVDGSTAGAGQFDEGTPVTVTAVHNTGYTFSNWTAGGIEVSTDANYTFVLNADTTLVANYVANPFTITLSSNPLTLFELNDALLSGQGTFDYGTSQTVTANSSPGYTFVNWTLGTSDGDEVSTLAEYTIINLIEDTTLVANYIATFKLNVTAENGTVDKSPVSPYNDDSTYNTGTIVDLNANPAGGYEFTSWTDDDDTGNILGTDTSLQVTMDSDKNITANFRLVVIAGGICPAPAVDLGTAKDYAILAKSGISTTGTTHVTGDMGISPAAASFITGFGLSLTAGGAFSTSSLVTGNIYAPGYANPTPANLTTAVSNMENAFTTANGLAVDFTELYAGNLNGQTLDPGVYKWGTGVDITNSIILDGGGVDCAAFVFQIAGDLTVASGTKIILQNGAKADNIFWVVAGSKAELGTTVDFSGNILSQNLISLNTGAVVKGRLLAQTEVTLIANQVVKPE